LIIISGFVRQDLSSIRKLLLPGGQSQPLSQDVNPLNLLFLVSRVTAEENDSEQRRQAKKQRQRCQIFTLLSVTHQASGGIHKLKRRACTFSDSSLQVFVMYLVKSTKIGKVDTKHMVHTLGMEPKGLHMLGTHCLSYNSSPGFAFYLFIYLFVYFGGWYL
jgi:hypothetical protein